MRPKQNSTEQLAAEEHVCVPPSLCADNVPYISDLKSGCLGESCSYPKVTINDIEKYLLYSSLRTEDSGKMQCYRQYIRGRNFYKEGYIHKIMINEISDTCQMCLYVQNVIHLCIKGRMSNGCWYRRRNLFKLSKPTVPVLQGKH